MKGKKYSINYGENESAKSEKSNQVEVQKKVKEDLLTNIIMVPPAIIAAPVAVEAAKYATATQTIGGLGYTTGTAASITSVTASTQVATTTGTASTSIAASVASVVIAGMILAAAAFVGFSMFGNVGKVGGELEWFNSLNNLQGKEIVVDGGSFKIPDNWILEKGNTEGVYVYRNPDNPKHDFIRVSPGNPNSPYPNSQGPYLRRFYDGTYVNPKMQSVPYTAPKGHMPILNVI